MLPMLFMWAGRKNEPAGDGLSEWLIWAVLLAGWLMQAVGWMVFGSWVWG